MAGAYHPADASTPGSNLPPGSPPPPSGADGEVQGGDPLLWWEWEQLDLPGMPPRPVEQLTLTDAGEQLTLPGLSRADMAVAEVREIRRRLERSA